MSAQGLELRYDAPFVTQRGLIKSSFFGVPVRARELRAAGSLGYRPCRTEPNRTEPNRTEPERRERERQVQRTFSPALLTRALRAARNWIGSAPECVPGCDSVVGPTMSWEGAGPVWGRRRRGSASRLRATIMAKNASILARNADNYVVTI